MDKLEHLEAIKKADDAYYNQDQPLLTDPEYDALRSDYIAKYGAEDLDYIPGKAVFEPYEHEVPVASLAKVKEGEAAKIEAAASKLWPVVVEPKLDGLTVVAYPADDGSCTFVTRGDGLVGEKLPFFIPKYQKRGVNKTGYAVRGEVFITASDFQKINEELIAEGKEPFANPRNAASGILRNKKPNPAFLQKLSYRVYDILGLDDSETTKIELIKMQTSFQPVELFEFASPQVLADGIGELYAKLRQKGDLPLDGMVIKSDKAGSLAEFGRTGHHPNNAVAWKAKEEGTDTKLVRIEWQLGRKYLTPVAVVVPVELAGSTVERASLSNISIIEKLGLSVGDTVHLIKANEIIPQIVAVVEKGDGEKITAPTTCPCCQTRLEKENDRLFCPNPNCVEKIAQNMAYLVSRKVLNGKGISLKICRRIVERTPDLYSILSYDLDAIGELEGFSPTVKNGTATPKKAATNLYAAIQSMQKTTLAKVIAATCTEGVGPMVADSLAKVAGTLGGMLDLLDYDKLTAIDGIGEELAKNLLAPEFKNRLLRLSELVSIDEPPPIVEATDGKNFVLTGKMPEPRSYYEDLLTTHGHRTQSAVSKTTDYLVIEDPASTSTKAKKARELGIELISPAQLLLMLGVE